MRFYVLIILRFSNQERIRILSGRIEFLKNVSLFSDFSDEDLKKVSTLTRKRVYQADEPVFQEKSQGNALYIIVNGSIRITKKIGKEREKELAVLQSGDMFGEMALIDRKPTSASATSREETEILHINKEDFDYLLSDDKDFALKILMKIAQVISYRLRQTNEKYMFATLMYWHR